MRLLQATSNLMTAITTAHQVEAISLDSTIPIVLTAGGSKDPIFGALLSTLTSRPVYAMYDNTGQAVTETTTLGAAISGKAACLGIHPYEVDTKSLGVRYRHVEALASDMAVALQSYRARWMQHLS
jgi:hypothetical protein